MSDMIFVNYGDDRQHIRCTCGRMMELVDPGDEDHCQVFICKNHDSFAQIAKAEEEAMSEVDKLKKENDELRKDNEELNDRIDRAIRRLTSKEEPSVAAVRAVSELCGKRVH